MPNASHRPPGKTPAGPRRRTASGFTIMEVMMATFVMALGIATSIIAMQSGFKQIETARTNTIASQILQSEMERLRMMSWTAITALPSEETVDLSTMFSSSAALAARFTVTRTCTADGTRPSDVRNISINVRWSTFDGVSHSRTFTSIYVKNGLYDYYYTLARP